MNITRQDVAATLEEIVRRYAPKNRASIQLATDTHLTNDAGIDSPRMIDIVLGVEDAFAITVEDDDIQSVKTFGQLVELVERAAGPLEPLQGLGELADGLHQPVRHPFRSEVVGIAWRRAHERDCAPAQPALNAVVTRVTRARGA